jgi:2-polyprenyl-3-methyl-5-hydroxy-6-metoxy-1,4-benzoquinol methylase
MIIEKKLGISPDYQYRALRRGWWPKANWHRNKLVALGWTGLFKKASRILDLGTGSGNLELEFATLVKEIVGVDYNDEALVFLKARLSEEKIANVKLRQADIRKIDRQKLLGKFDVVVMVDVIEHISKRDGEKLVRQLYRLIKPGGSACIITPNYKPTWIALETLLDKVSAVPKLTGEQHLAKYDPASLRAMFEVTGFKTDRLTTFNTVSWLVPGQSLSTAVCKAELAAAFGWGNLVLGVFTRPKR